MNINFTLVVQLINFFIAYILIERLLLRPAVAIIREEDEERFKLQNLVAFNKERLEQKEFDKQQEWRSLQEIFAKSIPRTITPELEVIKQVMIEPQSPDHQTVQKTIQEGTNFLIAKVGHD